MSTQPDTPAPQWAVEAAKEIMLSVYPCTLEAGIKATAEIIARHAPQPNIRNVEEALICHANFKRGDAMTAAVAEKIINTLYHE